MKRDVEASKQRWQGLLLMAWNNTWLKLGIRLGCTLLLIAYLLQSVSWPTVLLKLQRVDSGLLSIGIIIGLFGVIISAYLWQCLLDAEDIPMDLRKLVNLYLVGIAFNHFLPTGMGGDVVKAYYVGREKQNTSGATSAVVMSRLTGFLGMLIISVPVVLVWHSLFKPELTGTFLVSCLLMCLALGGAFLLVTILPQIPVLQKYAQFLSPLMKVGRTLRKSVSRPRTLCIATLFGVLFHASAALNYYCYARALGVGGVPVTFYLVAVPFVSLITFLPISINGYGLREGTFVYIFSQMNMMYKASPEVSLVIILLMDVQVLLFGVVGGAIYLAMGARKTKEVKEVPANLQLSPQELSV